MATQYIIGEDGANLPDGVVLAHTLYGEPDQTVTHAYTAAPSGLEVIALGETGIGYENAFREPPPPVIQDGVIRARPLPAERTNRCRAKDDTCMGWKISDSEFCAAHAGKLRPRHNEPAS